MTDAEHNEWLIQEKERLEQEAKKKKHSLQTEFEELEGKKPGKKVEETEKGEDEDEDEDEKTGERWTEPTDDDEYYL